MSERRPKPTNKKRNPSVRRVQAREGAPGVQQDPQPVPEQESEGLAERDRTNTEEKGDKTNMGYGPSFGDRIKEHKEMLIHIGIAVGIAVIISAVMLLTTAASKNELAAYKADTDTGLAAASAHYTEVQGQVNGILELGDLATLTNIDELLEQLHTHNLTMSATQTRLGNAEDQIRSTTTNLTALNGDVDAIEALGPLATLLGLEAVGNRTEANSLDIEALEAALSNAQNQTDTMAVGLEAVCNQTSAHNASIHTLAANVSALDTRANSTDTQIAGMESQITDIEDELANAINSPPESYLTGTAGNYTLHAKSSESGNFTATVHLVYSPPIAVGNTTSSNATAEFYSTMDWPKANRSYVPTLAYDGTDWLVVEVCFNIGTFEMSAATDRQVMVEFGGLDSAYEPDYAYVEVYPVLK